MKKKKLLFELTKAISKVDESMVKMTISQDVDLDATIIYSKTPLSYSLEMDAENIAILLLEKGANPESQLPVKSLIMFFVRFTLHPNSIKLSFFLHC